MTSSNLLAALADPLQSETLFRGLLESAPDAMLVVATDGAILLANAQAEALFGYAANDLIGQPIERLVPPRLRQRHIQQRTAYAANPAVRPMGGRLELDGVRKDGSEFPVEISLSPIETGFGRLLTCAIRDASERRQQMRAERQANLTLKARIDVTTAELRARDVAIASAAARIAAADLQGRKDEATIQRHARQQQALAILGQVALEEPDLDAFFARALPTIAAALDFELSHVLERLPEAGRFRLRTSVGHRDHDDARGPATVEDSVASFALGADGPVVIDDLRNDPRFRLSPLLHAHGVTSGLCLLLGERSAPFGVLGAYSTRQVAWGENDLLFARTAAALLTATIHRARAAAQLSAHLANLDQVVAERTAELTRSNEDLDDFAYIVSHDLKEPLRGIANYASFLLEDHLERLDGDGQRMLKTLGQLTEHMSHLLDTLLYYSRLGRSEPTLAAVDLQGVVQDVAASLAVMREEHRAEIRVSRPLPTVACDAVRVGEVFRNLITNALKYNESAAKVVEIGHLDTPDQQTGQTPVLYVRDNGIGIAERHRESVFNLFKRLHARDKYGGGTGSGLTIVRKLIQRHGGRIWVESTVGAGSTFFFTLGSQPA